MEVNRLDQLSQEVLLKGIALAAASLNGSFCCGGRLQVPAPVTVYYRSATEDKGHGTSAGWISFPPESENDLEGLSEVCHLATFGKGTTEVLDLSYRKALQLQPPYFAVSCSLVSALLLEEIQRLMMPEAYAIEAELEKLNIYGPGGHFKAHVDTPRGGNMFGSLVICLPSRHEGGQLIVRHEKKEVTLGWGESAEPKWAAFFSDCEHEILPVTSGHRVTLTYNLYTHGQVDLPRAIDLSSVPLYAQLKKAFECPAFLHDGGVLGFPCEHAYVNSKLNNASDLPSLLKGTDSIIYTITRALGIDVSVRPAVHYRSLEEKGIQICDKFPEEVIIDVPEDGISDDPDGWMHDKFGSSERSEIIWCHEPKNWQKAGIASFMYGNYPAAQETFYMVAVLLVDVPSFEKRIQLLTSSAPSSSSSSSLQTKAGKRKRDTRSTRKH